VTHDLPDESIARRLVMLRVGEEIYRLRQGKLTLRALAAKVGLSAPFLSDVEHGRRSVRRHLGKLAKALGVKPSHFAEVCGICPKCGGTGVLSNGETK
jgi:transcriptional regulator with XRE-family HTH domain